MKRPQPCTCAPEGVKMRTSGGENAHLRGWKCAPEGVSSLGEMGVPTLSTLSPPLRGRGEREGETAPSVLLRGAVSPRAPLHRPHHNRRPRIIPERFHEEPAQRRELAPLRGEAQQGEDVGELFGVHPCTLSGAVTWASRVAPCARLHTREKRRPCAREVLANVEVGADRSPQVSPTSAPQSRVTHPRDTPADRDALRSTRGRARARGTISGHYARARARRDREFSRQLSGSRDAVRAGAHTRARGARLTFANVSRRAPEAPRGEKQR